MTMWLCRSTYLIILSLKQVVLGFVVIAHRSLLFPRFLELPLVIHNFVPLCLHFCVLDLYETVQVLAVALLGVHLV